MGNRPVGGARMALRYIIYAIAVLLAIGFVKEVRADHGVALCGPDGQKACLTAATTAIITNAIYAKGESHTAWMLGVPLTLASEPS